MKLKLTEQQITGLLNDPSLGLMNDPEFQKYGPNLDRLFKLIGSAKKGDLSSITNDPNIKNIPYINDIIKAPNTPNAKGPMNFIKSKFAKNIPAGNIMMHPLGKQYPISSEFGLRNTNVGGRDHKGVDIAVASGSPVYAPMDGIVVASQDTTPNPCGGHIKLDHGTVITKFCHLRQLSVKNGDKVQKGQLIGYSGGGKTDPMRGRATGPHLHYEILNKGGIAMNPMSVRHDINLAEEVKKKPLNKIDEFAKFVKNELKIKHAPTIVITNKKDGIKTTANYDYGTDHKIMKVYGKNRMVVDIMRSVAHELIHHKQWEKGLLATPPPDIGGPIEDGANAIAGRLIKKFALVDPTIYDE